MTAVDLKDWPITRYETTDEFDCSILSSWPGASAQTPEPGEALLVGPGKRSSLDQFLPADDFENELSRETICMEQR